ncbi:MAG: hypothetical protein JW779_06440 [Candidatus Thorarchaeota archaeon]|nr:hypothetical protein [Candidatus Thorarchaeota archaeon]
MVTKKVFIVPHTHWDREWYLPFQRFRFTLVKLIDEILRILDEQDYVFMLDGQTVVLEDYMEIRPERRDELIKRIQEGKISVGPWYLLPDEWLVGGESLLRNLEFGQNIATDFKIPLMDIAYLPDQFGHTSAIPQILADLTKLRNVVLWRGVPSSVTTVPFTWKSHESSSCSINGIYLPLGYGNASMLPEDYEEFVRAVNDKIGELEPFSPVPIYLLMNGSDHRFPQPIAKEYAKRMSREDFEISVTHLRDFINELDNLLIEADYNRPVHTGEFRSPARAPLLQDTYSARMWIKQWNQKIENMLTREVEPIWTYLTSTLGLEYPYSFLKTSWKWLLRNQPHDSICGCSVDKTHEEMKARFSWAESICDGLMKEAEEQILRVEAASQETSVIVFNAGGSSPIHTYIEFTHPREKPVKGLRTDEGQIYDIQLLTSKEDVFMDTTIGMTTAKMGMRLLPGRKLMDFYINGVEYFDGVEPGVLELRFIADRHLIGDFDIEDLKKQANEIISSKKYKKIHLIAARPTQSVYASVVPLKPWAFSKLTPVEEAARSAPEDSLVANENHIENSYYLIAFNKDGSLNITNKNNGTTYQRLHMFEDYGDRGDEYTFSRVEPKKAIVKNVKRSVITAGPVVAEIAQTLVLELYESLDPSREKRSGKVEVPVHSVFRFYRDSPRIEVTTCLTNIAKDHRLRICFSLPFESNTTLTSTHFGCITRSAFPETIPAAEEREKRNAEYPEQPTGIQPQKAFIRVDDKDGPDAITIMNRGLPEVELVNGNCVALTLLRCIGWLSRSDLPERPMHAGPGEETPGAQEMNQEYQFHYGFLLHTKDEPISYSADHADTFQDSTKTITLSHSQIPDRLFEPIIHLTEPAIRISSMRVHDDSILVTLYNLQNKDIETEIHFAEYIKGVSEVKVDKCVTKDLSLKGQTAKLLFGAREIKMCRLTK